MFVSEVLEGEFTKWGYGDDVLIQAPTGAGKTTFILHTLLPFAIQHDREILYLSNRKILHLQIVRELCDIYGIPYDYMWDEKQAEFKGITVTTYQTLQGLLSARIAVSPIRFFYYIVADEVHYLAEDSTFNPDVARVISWIPQVSRGVFIAISATLRPAMPYLGFFDRGWIECYESEFCDIYTRESRDIVKGIRGQVDVLYYYSIPQKKMKYQIWIYDKVEEVVERINADDSGQKWLIFQSNKERACKNIRAKISKKSALVTADDKGGEVMREIIEDKKFSVLVLLTTKVLDNGVSLHDSAIQHIVLDTISQTEFLQMLGRRRRQNEDDCVNLYLPKLSANFFSSFLRQSVNPALEFIETPPHRLMEKIFSSQDLYDLGKRYFYLQDGQIILNMAAKKQLQEQKIFAEKMVDSLERDEFAFVKTQLKWLQMEDEYPNVHYLSEIRKNQALEDLKLILDGFKGNKMGKKEQEEFRQKVTNVLVVLFPEDIPHKSRQLGLKKINEFLERLGIREKISSISGKKKGEETEWILTEV